MARAPLEEELLPPITLEPLVAFFLEVDSPVPLVSPPAVLLESPPPSRFSSPFASPLFALPWEVADWPVLLLELDELRRFKRRDSGDSFWAEVALLSLEDDERALILED